MEKKKLYIGAQEPGIKSLIFALPWYNKVQSKSGQALRYHSSKAHSGFRSCPFPGLLDSWHHPCLLWRSSHVADQCFAALGHLWSGDCNAEKGFLSPGQFYARALAPCRQPSLEARRRCAGRRSVLAVARGSCALLQSKLIVGDWCFSSLWLPCGRRGQVLYFCLAI